MSTYEPAAVGRLSHVIDRAVHVLEQHLPRDGIARQRANYRNRPDPTYMTFGPKTHREFLNLKQLGG